MTPDPPFEKSLRRDLEKARSWEYVGWSWSVADTDQTSEATWPSGKAWLCKSLIPGSNPGVASKIRLIWKIFWLLSGLICGPLKKVYAVKI